ncbi:MAG: hypothetical protein Q4A98_07985 [Comamonadaceae bacterium]|nr:hypothetical protein [Comamonadaceae bacterium]
MPIMPKMADFVSFELEFWKNFTNQKEMKTPFFGNRGGMRRFR